MGKKEIKKSYEKVPVTCTLEKSVVDYLNIQAMKLKVPRSRLIENCILMAVEDIKILEKLGLIDAARIIRKIQERLGEDIKKVVVT